MEKKNWILLHKVHNHGESEVIRGMLEAQDIDVLLAQEGAAKAIGLNVGTLGEIQIHVKAEDIETAQELLQDFLSGS
jgi:hypothetical protein